MCDCNPSPLPILDSSLIIKLFVLGIASSFSHCIGMCGPIALGQTYKSLSLGRLKAAFSWEYYLGKALTYSFLTMLFLSFGKVLPKTPWLVFCKNILLIILILFYVIAGLQALMPSKRKKSSFKLKLKHARVYQRLLSGIILGFIPCGLVYSVILTISIAAKGYFEAFVAAMVFGLSTFPGLFVLSYCGTIKRKFFDILYVITILWNINFLFSLLTKSLH
jgi:sulfite exporter TauE/SafE